MCPWTCNNSLGTPFHLSFQLFPKVPNSIFLLLWYVDCSLQVVLKSRCGWVFFPKKKALTKLGSSLLVPFFFAPFVCWVFCIMEFCPRFFINLFLHLVSFFLLCCVGPVNTHHSFIILHSNLTIGLEKVAFLLPLLDMNPKHFCI